MPIFELYHVHKVEGQEIYPRIYRFDDSQDMQWDLQDKNTRQVYNVSMQVQEGKNMWHFSR